METEEQPWSAFITLCSDCGGCTLTDQAGPNEKERDGENNACRPCAKFAQLAQKLEQQTEEAIERHTRELHTRFGNALGALHQELTKQMATRGQTTETIIRDLEMRLAQTMKHLEEIKTSQKEPENESQTPRKEEDGEKEETDQANRNSPDSRGTQSHRTQPNRETKEPQTSGHQRRVLVVGDSNVNRFKRIYLQKVSKDERVEVMPLPGKGISEVRTAVEAARPDSNTMIIIHAGLNDCLNLSPLHEATKNIEEMASKFPGTAIQVCTQPETPAMGMTVLESIRELNQGLDQLCASHPENLELVDLHRTKERLRFPFNIQHYTQAASEAVGEQLAKRTKAFLARGKRERVDAAASPPQRGRVWSTPNGMQHCKAPAQYSVKGNPKAQHRSAWQRTERARVPGHVAPRDGQGWQCPCQGSQRGQGQRGTLPWKQWGGPLYRWPVDARGRL